MKRNYRLSKPADFRVLLRIGRRTETPLFRLIYRPNQLAHGRFAFVAPLSVDKRSSVRNRLRRMAREWVRKRPEFMQRPVDAVLFFKKEAVLVSRKKFYEELDQMLRRLAR